MISYLFEDTRFKFNIRRFTNRWIKAVAEAENRRIGEINIIFCSDPYILDVNIRSLDHHYYTDIITFDYCEGDILSGDLSSVSILSGTILHFTRQISIPSLTESLSTVFFIL